MPGKVEWKDRVQQDIFSYCFTLSIECLVLRQKCAKDAKIISWVLLDFQGYAKPSRLLPAGEVELCTDSSLEKMAKSFKVGRSESLYKVKLQTSTSYGSGLTDINAGILLCLIDQNGDSILQRIPASSIMDHHMRTENEAVSDILHFQRGSVDEFTFWGPKLGKIGALWISLESGQWRLGGMSLSVICPSQPSLEENNKYDNSYFGVQYDFVAEDVLLGEGSDISMIELKPSLVYEFSPDKSTLLNKNLPQSTSYETRNISNEESMKEYADLKSSLLLYDAILILAGSTITSFSAGESSAFAFLTGGVGGFLYLLVLQRSVDGLPTPTMDQAGTFDGFFKRFRGTTSTVVLAVAFAIFAAKFSMGDADVALAPKDIVVGMMGFLACKVAVVLAAFRPMQVQLRENE
ncbi:hypothetical protein LguiB_032135 [Lonicera macranthoides]